MPADDADSSAPKATGMDMTNDEFQKHSLAKIAELEEEMRIIGDRSNKRY